MKITFAQQAEKFLADSASRKRNPLRPESLRKYQGYVNNHLVPLIGKLPLQSVGGIVLKDVVTKLSEKGLGARAIGVNVFLVKKIRKSALSEDGGVAYPYEWSTEVIDAPAVDGAKQPTVNAQAVQDALSKASDHRKSLYALLAGSGLRISEALAIQVVPDDGVSTVWVPSESKIIVRQQRGRHGLAPTKTKAGEREVDLAPELNDFLVKNADTFNGFMFPGQENGYRDRLERDGIIGGFHAFRRFRVTHLRMNGVPDALVKYWTGHAAGNVTEQYTQVAGEIESRKHHAAKAGLGFQLPEII
jgi:integrase